MRGGGIAHHWLLQDLLPLTCAIIGPSVLAEVLNVAQGSTVPARQLLTAKRADYQLYLSKTELLQGCGVLRLFAG